MRWWFGPGRGAKRFRHLGSRGSFPISWRLFSRPLLHPAAGAQEKEEEGDGGIGGEAQGGLCQETPEGVGGGRGGPGSGFGLKGGGDLVGFPDERRYSVVGCGLVHLLGESAAQRLDFRLSHGALGHVKPVDPGHVALDAFTGYGLGADKVNGDAVLAEDSGEELHFGDGVAVDAEFSQGFLEDMGAEAFLVRGGVPADHHGAVGFGEGANEGYGVPAVSLIAAGFGDQMFRQQVKSGAVHVAYGEGVKPCLKKAIGRSVYIVGDDVPRLFPLFSARSALGFIVDADDAFDVCQDECVSGYVHSVQSQL